MSEITENIKLELWDETDVAKPQEQSPEFDYIKIIYNNFKKTDTAIGKNRQAINSEQNLLSGVEEVEKLTSPATWANRKWRQASSGTGTRERVTVEDTPNSQFQKGWKITGSTGTNTDICQDQVPVSIGQSYRISCYARKINGEPVLKMQYGKNPYISKTYVLIDREWQKYEFIFKIGEKNDNSTDGSTNIYFGISSCVGVLEICGMRLEKVDDELLTRINELEQEKEYLKELNNSLQETVLDTQTDVTETIVVNNSCEGIGMVNIHGGQKQEIIELPSTYQRVEYLESTGTQYINTGYYINPKTKIECEFQFTDSTKKQQRVFGVADSANNRLDCYVKDSLQLGWNWTEQDNQTNLNVNTNHTIDTNKHKIVIDGMNKTVKLDDIYSSTIVGNLTKTSTTSLTIMAYVRPQAQAFAYLKLYDFKIYENNILVRNFIACYRKSDNTAGLYDLVNDVFYENAGTGTFKIGTNKNNVITPSFEGLSEIEIVGDNVQLFDKDNATVINALLQASTVKLVANNDERTLVFKCDKNTTYTITKIAGARLRIAEFETEPQINSTGKNYKDNDKGTFLEYTTSNTAQYLVIGYAYVISSLDTNEQALFNSIKIVKGTRLGAYSSYGQGGITIVSSNKNMSKETSNIKTETAQYKNIVHCDFCLKKGETYTISFDTNNNGGRVYINEFIFDNDTRLNCNGQRQHITATATASGFFKNTVLLKTANTATTAYNISNVQIELANTNSSYEQHKGETLVMPFQKPFKAIQNIRDDFVRKDNVWYERHWIKRAYFDGSEEWHLSGNTANISFWGKANSIMTGFDTTKVEQSNNGSSTYLPHIASNYFKIVSLSNFFKDSICATCDYYNNNLELRLGLGLNSDITTVAQLKAKLEELNNSGNPLYVDYVLAEPELIKCTDEQCKILDKINTYKNTTIITTDNDLAKVSLKYKVDVLKAIENATAVAESET